MVGRFGRRVRNTLRRWLETFDGFIGALLAEAIEADVRDAGYLSVQEDIDSKTEASAESAGWGTSFSDVHADAR